MVGMGLLAARISANQWSELYVVRERHSFFRRLSQTFDDLLSHLAKLFPSIFCDAAQPTNFCKVVLIDK